MPNNFSGFVVCYKYEGGGYVVIKVKDIVVVWYVDVMFKEFNISGAESNGMAVAVIVYVKCVFAHPCCEEEAS